MYIILQGKTNFFWENMIDENMPWCLTTTILTIRFCIKNSSYNTSSKAKFSNMGGSMWTIWSIEDSSYDWLISWNCDAWTQFNHTILPLEFFPTIHIKHMFKNKQTQYPCKYLPPPQNATPIIKIWQQSNHPYKFKLNKYSSQTNIYPPFHLVQEICQNLKSYT